MQRDSKFCEQEPFHLQALPGMKKLHFQLITALCVSCILAALAGDFMHGSKDTDAIALNLTELAGQGQIELIDSQGLPDGAKGSGVVTLASATVSGTELADIEKNLFALGIPAGLKRYLRIYYTVTGTVTAGAISCFVADIAEMR